jgi:hypothetical protein
MTINKEELRRLAEAAKSRPDEYEWYDPSGGYAMDPVDLAFIAAANPSTILALLDEFEAAHAALLAIADEVDGNIRPTVRDVINGAPDANDIYEYCDEIDRLIAEAIQEQKP